MANMSIFKCKKCNKDLLRGEKEYAEEIERAICARCLYFEYIGVVTIADYINWLRGEHKMDGKTKTP